MKGALVILSPEGKELYRRSLAGVERGTSGYRDLENELKRMAGEGCTVVFRE